MSYLKPLKELNVPIKLGDKYINIKNNTNIVEAINICRLCYQGSFSDCVVTKHILTKQEVVYNLFDFATYFSEYNDDVETVIVNEENTIASPETIHDNYNFN